MKPLTWFLQASWAAPVDSGEDLLCNILFSLAYGALLLLSHTTLRLVRGRRYGVCASNGSGKSTLLRAIRDGKVEGFPTQDEVRAVMVEHSLQGEDASLPIIDFIAAGVSQLSVNCSFSYNRIFDGSYRQTTCWGGSQHHRRSIS